MSTRFVTDAGAGAHDGTTLLDAWSVDEHNSASLSAGDLVSLNGTISSVISVPNSGSEGNPITYQIVPGARFSSPMWPNSTGAIYVNQKDYITIDGVDRAGLIENTGNGTGLANSAPSRGIQGINANHLTIQNVRVQNIYVRQAGTDVADDDSACVSNKCAVLESITGFLVSGCSFTHAYRAMEADFGIGCYDYQFRNNAVSNCLWGGGVGDRSGSATLSGLIIAGNTFKNWQNWVDTDTDRNAYHANGFIVFGNAGTITGITIERNLLGPGWNGDAQTSGFYVNTNVADVSIRNNVFLCAAGEFAGNGLVTLQSSLATTLSVDNNTFVMGGASKTAIQLAGSGNGASVTMNVRNNVVEGNGAGTVIALYNNANVTLNADYNIGHNVTDSLAYIYSSTGSGIFKTFAEWQGLGFDTHGSNSDPMLAPSGPPESGSPALGSGLNLSSDFTTDFYGNTRSGWSIGAFENSYMGDSLILNQTSNSAPVTELVKRAAVVAGVASAPTEAVIHHSADYPSQPANDYVYTKHGSTTKHVFVFDGTLTLAQAIAARP